jgi:hypothetical protein
MVLWLCFYLLPFPGIEYFLETITELLLLLLLHHHSQQLRLHPSILYLLHYECHQVVVVVTTPPGSVFLVLISEYQQQLAVGLHKHQHFTQQVSSHYCIAQNYREDNVTNFRL